MQGVNRAIIHCDIVKILYRCHHNIGIIIIANIVLSFGPSRRVGGGRAELKHRRSARKNGQRAHARTENYVALRIAGFVIIYDHLPLPSTVPARPPTHHRPDKLLSQTFPLLRRIHITQNNIELSTPSAYLSFPPLTPVRRDTGPVLLLLLYYINIITQ